jgi:hypothetical protein
MFTIVTRNRHFGVLYNKCPLPCAAKPDDRLIPCVCTMAHYRIAVCHRIPREDYIALTEFFMEYLRSKSCEKSR